MNKFFKTLSILVTLMLFITACGPPAVQAEPARAESVPTTSYQAVLGKSLNDMDVADFIVNNNCSSAAEFQLCKEAGVALWMDVNQVVKTVYLYAGNVDGFRRYRGPLPYGLSFYDPMWRVEEKLMDLDSANILYQAGLPDETASLDHIHYWAVYKRLSMAVIYNSPGKDEDAYIYAILMSQ
jgi:hypothetical protein